MFSLQLILRFLLPLVFFSCAGKNPASPQQAEPATRQVIIGGGCDGCELMYIGMPAEISAIDTSAGWHEAGTKLLLRGRALQPDGITPAPNTIIYYWQTDSKGYYSDAATLDRRAIRHGHIRGWVKTDAQGNFAIYTIRPAPYPKENIPAHIHLAIKEPHIANEYYTDDLVFDDDPLLNTSARRAMENRGGSGVLRVEVDNGLLVAEHTIILGLNIPNYPRVAEITLQSELPVGFDQPSFMPFHAWGPDKGSRACPVCKYGRYQGVIYFVGDRPDWPDIRNWLTFLEAESRDRGKFLKVYFVYGNPAGYNKRVREAELEKLGRELSLQLLALTYLPSLTDEESEIIFSRINPKAANSFVVYRNRNIIARHSNLAATEAGFKQIRADLDRYRNETSPSQTRWVVRPFQPSAPENMH